MGKKAFWGGVAKGLADGLQSGMDRFERFQERGLRERMIGAHLRKMESEQAELERANNAFDRFQRLAIGGIDEPTLIGGPVQGPVTAEGEPPAEPPPTTRRPATVAELQGAALSAVPTAQRYRVLQQFLRPPRQDSSRYLGIGARRRNAGLPPGAKALIARRMALSPERWQAVTGRPYPLAPQQAQADNSVTAAGAATPTAGRETGLDDNVAFGELLKHELARQSTIGADEPISAMDRAKLRAWGLVSGPR